MVGADYFRIADHSLSFSVLNDLLPGDARPRSSADSRESKKCRGEAPFPVIAGRPCHLRTRTGRRATTRLSSLSSSNRKWRRGTSGVWHLQLGVAPVGSRLASAKSIQAVPVHQVMGLGGWRDLARRTARRYPIRSFNTRYGRLRSILGPGRLTARIEARSGCLPMLVLRVDV
jgi:hypothetical protein